jgi:hypothetical protein
LQTFRILSVAELGKDVKGYSISAVQHVPGKFAFIDNNIKIDPIPIAPIPSNVVPSPTGLAVVARDVVEQNSVNKVANLSWNPVPVASYYRVQWRMSSGSWVTIDKVGTADTDLVGVGTGQFEVQVIAIDVLGRQSSPTFGGPYSIDPVQSPPGYVNDINDQFTSVTIELNAVGAQADQLRVDVDAAVAQVQVLQGQIGDILQADTWDVAKTYPSGDLIQYSGKLYRSLINGNVGNEPTGATDANWEYIGNYASLGEAVGANAANVATLQNTVTQQGNTITANSQSIAQNAAAIGGKADASALSTTNATVTQQGNQITAIAADITLLGAHNAGKTAFVLDQNKVQIGGGQTFAQMLSGLQASDTALGARVDSEQNARVSGDAANASAITSVSVQQAEIITVVNGSFESSAGWGLGTGCSYSSAQKYSGSQSLRHDGPSGGYCYGGKKFTCTSGRSYRIDFKWMALGTGVAGNHGVVVQWFDASGNALTPSNVLAAIAPSGWVVKTNVVTAPAGAVQGRCDLSFGAHPTGTSVWVDDVVCQAIDPTVLVNAAAVTQLTAGTTIGGIAYAAATTMVDANGHIGGTRLASDGSVSSFAIAADQFSIVAPAGGARTEYSGGNWRVYDGAGTLRMRWGVA